MSGKKQLNKKLNNLRWHIRNSWYLIPIVIIIWIIVSYSYLRATDVNYWDGAVGGLLAAMVGVIVGVPIALEINRLRVAREEKKKTSEAKKKGKGVLSLIREELEFNLSRLEDRQKDATKLPTHPFKVDLWNTFSSSGELRWISNPNLLNRIVSAYHIIKIELGIEEKCYQSMHGATVQFDSGKTASQILLEEARMFDSLLRSNTKYAIKEIKKEINNL